jgi:hypothetical protein
MSDSERGLSVLKKLLKRENAPQAAAEKEIGSAFVKKKSTRPPGRPKVEDEKKAKNFTLCLAPKYVEFLDRMKVRDPKVQGRGRKIRFIIDRFLEHEKRQILQMKVLKETLKGVEEVLRTLQPQKKAQLTNKERDTVAQVVGQVKTLLKVLGYTPQSLQKILTPQEWAVLSFALSWGLKREIVL